MLLDILYLRTIQSHIGCFCSTTQFSHAWSCEIEVKCMNMLQLVSDMLYLATERVLTYSIKFLPPGTLLFHLTVINLNNSLSLC